MLLTIQFPAADIRGFVPEQTYRLDVPHWPLVRPGEEFVRSFGVVRLRGSGGLDDWVGEDVFCRADRALRLASSLEKLDTRLRGTGLRSSCAFRRLLYDGAAVTRFEIGIRFTPRKRSPGISLRSSEFLFLLRELLDLPVQIATHEGIPYECPLARASTPLSVHYLRSTTRRSEGDRSTIQPHWVLPARPLVIVEYERGELTSLPPDCQRVTLESASRIRLHHSRFTPARGKVPWGVWLLGVGNRSDADYVRKLRMHLSRLHAEKQCLREVLRAVGQRRLEIRAGSEPTDHLQAYLKSALRLLGRKSRFGLPQSTLLLVAAQSEDAIAPGERHTLLTELARVRGNILRAVEQYTGAPQLTPSTLIQAQTMTNITLGDGANFTGNLVIARTVQNAFNRVDESGAEQNLRNALQDLAKALAAIAPLLSVQRSEEIARDMEALMGEALSSAPRKRWYQVSAEGLIEAARGVGESAGPVVDAVNKVLALLA